jgi:hypothetical protein
MSFLIFLFLIGATQQERVHALLLARLVRLAAVGGIHRLDGAQRRQHGAGDDRTGGGAVQGVCAARPVGYAIHVVLVLTQI